MSNMTDAIISPVVAFTLAALAGLYGVLKMIFTNQTKIQVLEAQLKSMDTVLQEVRSDQKELFKEIKSLQK
jgi:membrane protein insertase Oxa1/YidC/SpoIIIJ